MIDTCVNTEGQTSYSKIQITLFLVIFGRRHPSITGTKKTGETNIVVSKYLMFLREDQFHRNAV